MSFVQSPELCTIVRVPFGYQDVLWPFRQRIDERFGVSGHNKLRPFRSFRQGFGDDLYGFGMKADFRFLDADQRRELWFEQYGQEAKKLKSAVRQPPRHQRLQQPAFLDIGFRD